MKLSVTEKKIKICEPNCWVCGSGKNLTVHHSIPQYLNPLKNVEIPVCRECHDKLHHEDMTLLSAFAYRIKKTLDKGVNNIHHLKNLLNQREGKE